MRSSKPWRRRLKRRSRRLLALAAVCAAVPLAHGEIPEKFRDAEDGQLDMSDYLLRHRGVLPVPLIVTEPAIGYGGGLALAYFSQSFEQRAEEARARGDPVTPPNITVGFGMKTENGTWAGGIGHMGFYDHDRWRYVGGLGKAELQLDYFSLSGEARAYRLDATAIIQQLVRRIGTTDWFAGARYTYVSTQSRFAVDRPGD